MASKTVLWLSGGVSSFVAGYLIKDQIDEVIYIDIDDQHPDTIRFCKECAAAIGKGLTVLSQDTVQ